MTLSLSSNIWLGIGLIGQGIFASRFLVQWLASEKQGRSVIPHVFWYLSLFGSIVLLSYAVHRQDPVFILGQSLGLFIYCRNIYFVKTNPS